MDIDFTVTFDYGDDGPGEGEPTPDPDDLAGWIRAGMARGGWTSVDVQCTLVQ